MGELGQMFQVRIKKTSDGLLSFIFRLLSGAFIGLTLALVGEQIFLYATLSFLLVIIFVTGIFLRVTRGLGFWAVLLVDLVCVLLALLFRMYLLVAP